MNISVIGGEGFIGKHLMQQGKSMGHRMTSIDVVMASDINRWAKNLRDSDFEACERIIWSAGKLGTVETFDEIEYTIDVNVTSLVHVLTISQHLGILFTHITLAHEWLNPYMITKNCASEFCRMFGLETPVQNILTYNAFGPYQKTAPVRKMVPYFMTQLLKGEPIELYFGGTQVVDMIYAPDLARDILGNEGTGDFYVGTGEAITVKKVAEMCGQALGVTPTFIDVGPRKGETAQATVSPVRMKTITPIKEAMYITAKWYKEQYERDSKL